ncbi:MAG: hypothetical protein ACRDZV_08375 [Acidimicrobiia bacterium]
MRFRPTEVLRHLAEHEVEYVLIGGLAATLHGSPVRTGDADICPAPAPANLARLAAALRSMDAGLRVEGEPGRIPFRCDAQFLARMEIVNLRTRFGALDISKQPAGTDGYADLTEHAVEMQVGDFKVAVASLSDVIRSKEAANRPKDHETLPTLYALRDEIAEQERRAGPRR